MSDANNHAAIRAEIEMRDKAIANLRARAALAGYALHIVSTPGGGSEFVASRWGLITSPLKRIEDVEDFLRRIGATQ